MFFILRVTSLGNPEAFHTQINNFLQRKKLTVPKSVHICLRLGVEATMRDEVIVASQLNFLESFIMISSS